MCDQCIEDGAVGQARGPRHSIGSPVEIDGLVVQAYVREDEDGPKISVSPAVGGRPNEAQQKGMIAHGEMIKRIVEDFVRFTRTR